jgi:hypothetical protein
MLDQAPSIEVLRYENAVLDSACKLLQLFTTWPSLMHTWAGNNPVDLIELDSIPCRDLTRDLPGYSNAKKTASRARKNQRQELAPNLSFKKRLNSIDIKSSNLQPQAVLHSVSDHHIIEVPVDRRNSLPFNLNICPLLINNQL